MRTYTVIERQEGGQEQTILVSGPEQTALGAIDGRIANLKARGFTHVRGSYAHGFLLTNCCGDTRNLAIRLLP